MKNIWIEDRHELGLIDKLNLNFTAIIDGTCPSSEEISNALVAKHKYTHHIKL